LRPSAACPGPATSRARGSMQAGHPTSAVHARLPGASAACTQAREVKPRVYRVHPQQILPVHRAPHGVRSLPIREVCRTRQDRDECEAPRECGRRPTSEKQVREDPLSIHHCPRIAKGQRQVAFRKSSSRHLGRCCGDLCSRLWAQGHGSFSSNDGRKNDPHSTWIPREGAFAQQSP
jgi:hypothetical protein